MPKTTKKPENSPKKTPNRPKKYAKKTDLDKLRDIAHKLIGRLEKQLEMELKKPLEALEEIPVKKAPAGGKKPAPSSPQMSIKNSILSTLVVLIDIVTKLEKAKPEKDGKNPAPEASVLSPADMALVQHYLDKLPE